MAFDMLISTDKRFVLLSPTRVASSSVGSLLSPFCDIRIGDPTFGKHDQISEVVERYRWLFDRLSLREFKIFLLFRNPLERALSLRKFHSGIEFRGSRTSTFGMSTRTFVSSWVIENTWMSLPQFLHGFCRDHGFVVDFVIRAENLAVDLVAALNSVGVTVNIDWLVSSNGSQNISNEDGVKAELLEELGDLYAIDQYIFDHIVGRLLSTTEKTALSNYVSAYYDGKTTRDNIQNCILERFKARVCYDPHHSSS